jgi:hypothetical protein
VQAVRSCSWPECMVMRCYSFPVRRPGPVNLGAHRDAVAKEEALSRQQQRLLLRREGGSSVHATNGDSSVHATMGRNRWWQNPLLTAQAIEGFVANAPNKTRLRLGLQRNFALVTAMIKAHPCLKRDFQVYLRNDGAVLNIDLDRCRNTSGSVSHNDRLSWCVDKNRLENETNNDRALESPEANLSRYVNWVFGVGS